MKPLTTVRSSGLVRFVPLALASLCLLSGCGTAVGYTPLNAPPRPPSPRPAAQVEVFTSATPPRPFVEVGFFEARDLTAYGSNGPGAMIEAMRASAGERGCDGLVVTGAAAEVKHDVHGKPSLHGTVRGACIMYR
jgi:hypothetical protein